MTQADSAHALRRSLDSEPIGDGQTTPEVRRWASCVVCGHGTSAPVRIGTAETQSGPGRPIYADDNCARIYAGSLDAPEWLRNQYATSP